MAASQTARRTPRSHLLLLCRTPPSAAGRGKGTQPAAVSIPASNGKAQAARDGGGAAAQRSPRKGKGGGGKSARQRAVEAHCPPELVDHLHDADMQGLVIECALGLPPFLLRQCSS